MRGSATAVSTILDCYNRRPAGLGGFESSWYPEIDFGSIGTSSIPCSLPSTFFEAMGARGQAAS